MSFKKAIRDFLVITALFIVVFLLVKVFFIFLGRYLHFNNNTVWLFVCCLLVTLWLYAITYKKLWTGKALNGAFRAIGFYLLMFTTVFVLMGAKLLKDQTDKFYKYVRSDAKERGWRGMAHAPDDTLGFRPVPGASAYHTFPYGNDIPMHYNSRGFRVPLTDSSLTDPGKPVDILFLGCSFTYGDACYAEQTFSYLVAKEKRLNYINAGVCSYGLSHMLILARKLIPQYKPRYVVVQYSPWLVQRATTLYAPSYIGLIPNPYFTKHNNTVDFELPVFSNIVVTVNKEEVKKRSNFSAYFLYCMPRILKEDINSALASVRLFFSKEKRPYTNSEEVEKYAYSEIFKIAADNGAKPILLRLGFADTVSYSYPGYLPRIAMANADSALNAYKLQVHAMPGHNIYAHYRYDGKDSVMVDAHPNPLAHRIIANTLVDQIN